MDTREIVMTLFHLLGGLAIFILGMELMTSGLRAFAKNKLRAILSHATENRLYGVGLGTVLGLLVHSSAASVMYVGFVNAGLMTLAQSIPPILGANFGTSLAMQLISFNLTDYSYIAIGIGFGLRLGGVKPKLKDAGTTLLGFGLLFLGMETMSGAIEPHKDLLQPYLARIDGATVGGMLLGILISTLITGIIQSSGATIGMSFVLIQSGVFTQLSQVYPIILGAHIGTCVTAQLASIGTNISARRTALAHLFFNLANVAMAALAAPLFLWLIPLTTSDLVHQAANLHTGVMLVATLLVLPVTPQFARLVQLLVPSAKPPPQPSYLDREKLDRPETAIRATIRELKRAASICEDSLILCQGVFLYGNRENRDKRIKLNEQAIDDIKDEMGDYLTDLTHRYMSRRQILLAEYVNQCVAHIERVHDHIDAISDLSVRRHREHAAAFDHEAMEQIFRLFGDARRVLELLTASLNADTGKDEEAAQALSEQHNHFHQHAKEIGEDFASRVAAHDFPPIVGIFFGEYLAAFARLVRHARAVTDVQRDKDFFVKSRKLGRIEEELDARQNMPGEEDPDDFQQAHHMQLEPKDDDTPDETDDAETPGGSS